MAEKFIHNLPQSATRMFYLDCAKWMLCVPHISPDSPRFAQYFSRWLVPDKIFAAKKRGDFAEITKNCPPIAPELLTYIQSGIDAYTAFTGRQLTPAEFNPPRSSRVNVLSAAA